MKSGLKEKAKAKIRKIKLMLPWEGTCPVTRAHLRHKDIRSELLELEGLIDQMGAWHEEEISNAGSINPVDFGMYVERRKY